MRENEKSFKALLRGMWENWMINGQKQYTKSGNLKRASYEEICQWISESWEVPVTTIRNGFNRTTIDFYDDLQNNSDYDNDVNSDSSDVRNDDNEDQNNEDQIQQKLVHIKKKKIQKI